MASPWLALKQAREALRSGQPDEARRVLEPLAAEGYREAVRLTREVARAYLQRAERYLQVDDADAAWRELLAAESLNTGEKSALQLRQTLTRLGLAQCRAALEVGNPIRVMEMSAGLRDRFVRGPEFDVLEAAAQEWLLASDQADRGDFELARTTLDHVRKKLDPILAVGLDRFAADLETRHGRFRNAISQLKDAAESRSWREAVKWADAVTASAPDHREARSLRAKAWEALHPETATYAGQIVIEDSADSIVPLTPSRIDLHPEGRSPTRPFTQTPPHGSSYAAATDVVPLPGAPGLPRRFLLWVDGVGGYLVCLAPRVTFGQAVADGPVDVPLFADVSRLHAELSRDEEGYVIESGREIRINGASAKRSSLKSGDRVTLGVTCQFQLHQPVPISPTARLELVSGQRLPLAVDGVILMAESLILGPGARVHVRLPWAAENVILYRSGEGLGVRYDHPYTVDGRPAKGRSPLSVPGVVSADNFTFAVEPVGSRL